MDDDAGFSLPQYVEDVAFFAFAEDVGVGGLTAVFRHRVQLFYVGQT